MRVGGRGSCGVWGFPVSGTTSRTVFRFPFYHSRYISAFLQTAQPRSKSCCSAAPSSATPPSATSTAAFRFQQGAQSDASTSRTKLTLITRLSVRTSKGRRCVAPASLGHLSLEPHRALLFLVRRSDGPCNRNRLGEWHRGRGCRLDPWFRGAATTTPADATALALIPAAAEVSIFPGKGLAENRGGDGGGSCVSKPGAFAMAWSCRMIRA